MPNFTYHYLQNGKKRKGTIEATSLEEARRLLHEKRLLVTGFVKGRTKKRLNLQDRATYISGLHQLIQAGLPVYESLLALEEQMEHAPNLSEQIKKGFPLSQTLRAHFDPLTCAMLAAGEATGQLAPALDNLKQLLSRQIKLRKQLTSALLYPSILAIFCLVVITCLLLFVIPSITQLIEHPTGLTAAILFASRHWYLIPLLLPCAYFLRKPLSHLTKPLLLRASLARFMRTLATLQEAGVPLIEALALARQTITHPELKAAILRLDAPLIGGSSLSRELKKEAVIPALVPRMLAIGEESGNLTPSLHQLADIYEQELEKQLTRLTTLAQPVILIVMGGIIGLIMLAVLLPLTDMSTILEGGTP